jgi:tetratricopeptide (TPR) repeat protein
MDVEDIAPGQLFAQKIDDTIARCDIALIVIGPRWADIIRERAQREQPDYVRHEVESALARQITVVPVFVGGASIAELTDLPGQLPTLSQHEAAELRDSTFNDDCTRLTKSLGLQPVVANGRSADKARSRLMFVLAAIVLIGLSFLGSGWLGIGPWGKYRARKAAVSQMFTTARMQTERGEYDAAFKTYQDLLKSDPGNRVAMDQQVDAAMQWIEDFHVIAPEGGNAANLAGTRLDAIMPVFDAGLARTGGTGVRAADILAHLGWAHWLNQKLAEREFGPGAERDLRQALQIDPTNVFAHAMLGNWIMQNGRKTEEALTHFRAAVETNKARPFVRQLQLGVLVYPRDSETRVALIRLANEMRRNGESLDERERRRILTAYDPTVNSEEELAEDLSAVPPDEGWATYQWLEMPNTDGNRFRPQHEFIQASILEMQLNREDALKAFENLRSALKQRGSGGRILKYVDNAIKRLSVH